jgi:hypothetical protein
MVWNTDGVLIKPQINEYNIIEIKLTETKKNYFGRTPKNI